MDWRCGGEKKLYLSDQHLRRNYILHSSRQKDQPRVMGQFGLRVGPVEREIPSVSLRAGSSIRLKNGCVQDGN
jgi:hypothetical protein